MMMGEGSRAWQAPEASTPVAKPPEESRCLALFTS